jgi:heme o synthase
MTDIGEVAPGLGPALDDRRRYRTGVAPRPWTGPPQRGAVVQWLAPEGRAYPVRAMLVSTRPSLRTRLGAYVALTKPRIIELLLVTTVPTMVVAERGLPSLWLMTCTVLGGTFAAGGANAINMYVDRDIDRLMQRTKRRPLVTGAVTPRAALTFAIGLEVVAFVFLWATVNLLSAVLAVAACLFYVFVYTLWLKRSSSRNIVIGGAAGAAPVLIGWSAVTNTIDWPPIVLFAVIFYWTPPHFWALAIRYRDDYAAADVPMLPVVASLHRTATRILGYTVLLWALTVLFSPVAGMGNLYLGSALVLGGVFTLLAVRLLRLSGSTADAAASSAPAVAGDTGVVAGPESASELALRTSAMRLFGWSITYITLLFAAMAADQLLRSGW